MSAAIWRTGDSYSARQGQRSSHSGYVKPSPVLQRDPSVQPFSYVPTSGLSAARPLLTRMDSAPPGALARGLPPPPPWHESPTSAAAMHVGAAAAQEGLNSAGFGVSRSFSVGARPRPGLSSRTDSSLPLPLPKKPSNLSMKLGTLPEGSLATGVPTNGRPAVPSKPGAKRSDGTEAEPLVSLGHSSPSPKASQKSPDYLSRVPLRPEPAFHAHKSPPPSNSSSDDSIRTTARSRATNGTSSTEHSDLLIDLSLTNDDAARSANDRPHSRPCSTHLPARNSSAQTEQTFVTYAQPPPREMEYLERDHPKNVFEYLARMRNQKKLCDVILIANGEEIHAHKVVLAACSQYFEEMFIGEFSEPEGEPIYIDEVEGDALIALVDFAYTSRIKITNHNVYSVFEAADLLQFIGVKSTCFKFFKQQINKSNCIRTWLFAESHNCTELMEASLKYLECNFLEISRGREFVDLDQPDVVARIVALEDLAITSEEQVYEGVLRWLQHDPGKRREHAATVLKNVRFPCMARDYLLHIVDNEALVKEDPDCLQQLIEALQTHVSTKHSMLRRILKKQKSSGSYSNVQPRPASMAAEVRARDGERGMMGGREE